MPGRADSDPRELAEILEDDDLITEGDKNTPAALGELLDNEVGRDRAEPAAPPDVSDLVTRKAPPAAPQAAVSTAQPSPPAATGGSSSMKYVVLALVVLLGVGAAAWFGNLIPR